MNKSSHTSENFAEVQVNQDTEAALSNTSEATDAGPEGERSQTGLLIPRLTRDEEVEDDPRRRPGAYAIPGVLASPSFASSEFSSSQDTVAEPADSITRLRAELVDEAAED